MGNWEDWALTLSVLIPLVGAIVIAVLPRGADQAAKGLAVAFSLVTFLVTLGILFTFDFGTTDKQYQFEQNREWISAINSNYHVGIDGIALPMVVLTGLLTFLCAIYSLKVIPAPGNAKALLSLMLLLEVGMMGTFIALDLILFFVFWEVVLVPMYFMIAVWGGPNRNYASVKFFLYTLFGSAFMLLGFLAMFFEGGGTFDIPLLTQAGAEGAFSRNFQYLAYLGLFLGLAIKVPMWPMHTWLPDAHTEAPTIGSVLLAGIMLKMGTYGFIRIANPILPDGAKAFAPYIAILATIAIIYGALCCLAQREIKRMIAFSSVGHMGFVMLGLATLTPTGTSAAVFGMVAHGVITGMLFFIVGSVKERYHTGGIAEIGGGMMAKMPVHGLAADFRRDRLARAAGPRRVLGRDARAARCVGTCGRPQQGPVPRPDGRRCDRHDPDRRLLPLAAAARQPGRRPGAVAHREVQRRHRHRAGRVDAAARPDPRARRLPALHLRDHRPGDGLRARAVHQGLTLCCRPSTTTRSCPS
jgi:NADH-quinone oxidoreductase subunit M